MHKQQKAPGDDPNEELLKRAAGKLNLSEECREFARGLLSRFGGHLTRMFPEGERSTIGALILLACEVTRDYREPQRIARSVGAPKPSIEQVFGLFFDKLPIIRTDDAMVSFDELARAVGMEVSTTNREMYENRKAKTRAGRSIAFAFARDHLRKHPKASYREVRQAAEKRQLLVLPVVYGRAQAILGIVKVRKHRK